MLNYIPIESPCFIIVFFCSWQSWFLYYCEAYSVIIKNYSSHFLIWKIFFKHLKKSYSSNFFGRIYLGGVVTLLHGINPCLSLQLGWLGTTWICTMSRAAYIKIYYKPKYAYIPSNLIHIFTKYSLIKCIYVIHKYSIVYYITYLQYYEKQTIVKTVLSSETHVCYDTFIKHFLPFCSKSWYL